MMRYILKRLRHAVPLLLGIATVTAFTNGPHGRDPVWRMMDELWLEVAR